MFRSYGRFKLVPHKFDNPSIFDFHTGTHLQFLTLKKARQALQYAKKHLSEKPELTHALFPAYLQEHRNGHSS